MRVLTEKEKKLNVIRLILCAVCLSAMGILGVYNLTRLRFPAAKTSDAASAAFIYVATALPFLLFSVLAAAKNLCEKPRPSCSYSPCLTSSESVLPILRA